MAARLSGALRDAATSPSEAIEAVKHLLTLQADGARCVADADPLGLYLDAQARRARARACPRCSHAVTSVLSCGVRACLGQVLGEGVGSEQIARTPGPGATLCLPIRQSPAARQPGIEALWGCPHVRVVRRGSATAPRRARRTRTCTR
jgi:hypothetical protein